MKKFVMLYTLTAAIILSIVAVGNSMKSSVTRVTTVKVVPSTVENTITCTGRVEAFPGNCVYASKPGIVKKVYVKPGDTVKAGQSIMDIRPFISNPSSTSSSSIPDYSKAYAAYEALLKSQSSAVPPSGMFSSGTQSGVSSTDESSSEEYTLQTSNSGIVETLSPTTVGSYIDSSSPVAVIRNENGLQVRLSVDEAQISDLKAGQKVQISGVGFKSSVYSGTIKTISDEAKQTIITTGQETVVEVIASVNNPGADIKPGFTAKAKITTSQNNRVLNVPYEAVREDSDNNEYVFCAINGKAKKVIIATGREFDTGFEVKRGIKAGDTVITDPDDVLDGAKIVTIGSAVGEVHG